MEFGAFTPKNLAYTAVAAGANALYNQFTAGQRAVNATRRDPPFVTMPLRKSTMRRTTFRRRKAYIPRRVNVNMRNEFMPMVRCTGPSTVTMASGLSTSYTDTTLAGVSYGDLTGSYDVYRIRKVTAVFQPLQDAGAGQPVLLFQACCDTQGVSTSLSSDNAVGTFGNYKTAYVPSGRSFTYTYYPKAINTVDNAGTATAVGSYGQNPWLLLTGSGVAIPHKRLLWRVIDTNTGVGTQKFSLFFQVHFDVKRTR